MEQRKFRIGEIKLLARQSLEGSWKQIIPIFSVYILLLFAIPWVVGYVFDPLTYPDPYVAAAANSGATLYSLLVAGPFAVGAAALVLKLIRKKSVSISDVFEGFKCWGTSFCAFILVAVYSALWFLASLLPGTILFGAAVFNGFDVETFYYDPNLSAISTINKMSLYLIVAAISLIIILSIVSLFFILRYQMTFFAIADRSGKLKARDAIKESRRIMKGNIFKLFGLSFSFIGWFFLLFLGIAAASVLYNLHLLSSIPETVRMIILSLCVLTIIILVFAWVAIQVYIQTSYAVFYSIYSGNVKVSYPSSGATADDSASKSAEMDVIAEAAVEPAESDTEKTAFEDPRLETLMRLRKQILGSPDDMADDKHATKDQNED